MRTQTPQRKDRFSEETPDYALLDCGGGRRLERFGGVIVDRPAPAARFAPALPEGEWKRAALRFDRESGWRGGAPEDWRIAFGSVVLILQPAAGGQIGVFPEHAAVSASLDSLLASLTPPDGGWRILNLFAHTGLATLGFASRSDVAAVAHVDAAPAAVRRARENAAVSGLSDAPVRWLVDDVLAFMAREARRARIYDCILADPPAYGRQKGGGEWKLERDLPKLLALAGQLLPEAGGIFCLTGHREDGRGGDWEKMAGAALPSLTKIEARRLRLTPESGAGALSAGEMLLARE